MMTSKISILRIIVYTCLTLFFIIMEAPVLDSMQFKPGIASRIALTVMIILTSVLTTIIFVWIYEFIKKRKTKKVDFLGIVIFLFFAFIAMIIETPILLRNINLQAGYIYSTLFVLLSVLLPALTAYSLIWILGCTYNFSHDQWRNGIVHCIFLFNVVAGLLFSLGLFGNNPLIIMVPAIISYFIVAIILVFYQIPPVMIIAVILSVLVYLPSAQRNGSMVFAITSGPPANPEALMNYLLSMAMFLGSGGSMSLVLVLSVIFTCVYYPRRVQFSRFFLPQYTVNRKKVNTQGFTLIELLIVVSLVGIMASAFSRYIGQSIQSARDYKERVCIEQILSSEMNYLLQSAASTAVVSDQPAPIPLSEFKINFPLTAVYTIEDVSDSPGLVRISVTATEKLDEETNKNYRLVSFKRARK